MTEKAEQQNLLYQRLTQSIENSPGTTTPLLRKTLVDYATYGNSGFVPESSPPLDLQNYVTKVRQHAYKVTDADIEQLHHAGYSEEAIFEITISTALGAGTRCLLRGMAALKGASDAIEDHSTDSQG